MLLLLCGFFPAQLPSWTDFLLWPLMAVAALLLDRLLGEPQCWHPLVLFGRWAGWLEQQLNNGSERGRLWRGALATLLALSPLTVLLVLLFWLQNWWWLWITANIFILYSCIGWRSLQQHVQAVVLALQQDDLPLAQEKLSWIVSRSTTELSRGEVSQATIESLLENSSDALFASLFWFALGGAPAALLHRWVNTLDAMWGYRNERFSCFGRVAARLDDVLAFWPARLCAIGFVATAGQRSGYGAVQALRCWHEQAEDCASPNGGVVMTAGAGALGVTLSERACYHGVWKSKPPMGCGRPAQQTDIRRALVLVSRTLWGWMLLWLLLAWASL